MGLVSRIGSSGDAPACPPLQRIQPSSGRLGAFQADSCIPHWCGGHLTGGATGHGSRTPSRYQLGTVSLASTCLLRPTYLRCSCTHITRAPPDHSLADADRRPRGPRSQLEPYGSRAAWVARRPRASVWTPGGQRNGHAFPPMQTAGKLMATRQRHNTQSLPGEAGNPPRNDLCLGSSATTASARLLVQAQPTLATSARFPIPRQQGTMSASRDTPLS